MKDLGAEIEQILRPLRPIGKDLEQQLLPHFGCMDRGDR
jgi:hypothetical protein